MSDQPPETSFADVLNGINGPSRRPKGERRGLFRRRGRDAPEETPDAGGVDAADEGTTSFEAAGLPDAVARRGYGGPHGYGGPGGVATPPGEPDLRTQPVDVAITGEPSGRHEMPEPGPGPEQEASIVRPYAWTRGRTRSNFDLAVETLVSTTSRGRDTQQVRQYEHRAVAELCREPRSVAEVAALLKLPLGVARVLLGDMALQDLVVVHETAGSAGEVPDMALMERVLSGLRRL